MGENTSPEERLDGDARDAGESPYVLPPVVRRPLADQLEIRLAILRVIEQAERERSRKD